MSQTIEDKHAAPRVLEGLINRAELEAEFRCGSRTIIRYERAGMPFIAVGNLRLYDPQHVREWLVSQASRHDAPKRGRPPGRRAA
jgi:phage terminase Nu1 subunit (DNA packaging protein)